MISRYSSRLVIVIASLIGALGSPAARAGFVEDWDLFIGAVPGNVDGTGNRFETPVSPFVESHSVNSANVFASSYYNFLWDELSGNFDVTTSLEVSSLPGSIRRATSRGFIFLRSSSPLSVSAVSQFDYDLSVHPSAAFLTTSISRFEPAETFAGGLTSYSTTVNGPRADSLQFAFQDILIPANELFLITYSFVIDTDDDVPVPSIATGVGSAHFEIVAVPEPSAALLVMVAVTPVLLRRRRSR